MARGVKPMNRAKRVLEGRRRVIVKKKDRKTAKVEKKKAEAEAPPDAKPEKQIPRTIEAVREADDTIVAGADPEVLQEECDDEFSRYFSAEVAPRILVTTQLRPARDAQLFVQELCAIWPHARYKSRRPGNLSTLCSDAAQKGYTDVICVTETHTRVTGMIISHLPHGPTATFRVSSFTPHSELAHPGVRTPHTPELFLRNFTTRLGRRVARLLHALFPPAPDLPGRAVATMANQRDFIFFRMHRYIFSNSEKVLLQELGPRFTMRLTSLQLGAFDPGRGQFEWKEDYKRTGQSRRKFQL
eukprot:TRINITY_DN57795_c0_g1_i1.p1 TRINITY_DN57795_c0_g1~~TRINITY_DN57795_c0_g1_i1.p1  ORF type:complete len:300 (+),score=39.08 TRINITY_DN57795_c0_g1_i1:55-954(+)